MSTFGRFVAISAALAAIGLGGAAIGSADPSSTGGSGGYIDTDGTQGEMKPAGQGVADDDGFQGAYSKGSTYVWPQYR